MKNIMMKTAILAGAALLACGCVLTAKAETSQDTIEMVQKQQEIHLKEVGITGRKNIQSALNLCERDKKSKTGQYMGSHGTRVVGVLP